ncbi:hypothetical protein HBI56_078020 [Parastagonospora nodorum]|uniref:Heterokaryon incompatibility domain-containing protein n=2 Tax=Phaeosphaeria nodorum (strain SN15 / ATCC MYA-4574 / FGSC 10173) TaxID=321614 RepID=A0A7U2EW21_PHANO|nr:hypothetical protein SNOG_07438 [Parastagonospora nodorum SN15]KAH3910247.1 hypothetical protein HBH56_149160 [Parastagonospora nodorum]EAT84904.1 hypothetical protein SNOG_07438 [Parastagonospora nodorum SN15]KAH3923293.1 hypothetical protein HBH54_213800 [Parastagonospora nodorum]KAH3946025.1 hypothetical protein HBH53_136600 [Parastagonospora nodorum]KAH3983836.1 hypothetical protein HBH52_063400 [Parastagonospora nodorum]
MTFQTLKTTWNKRAWTYQEYHFSDLCLVFANQRAYYECRSSTRSEVMPHDFTQELTMKVSYHPPETTGTALGLLQHHLFYYEDRQLTFEHDILDAFSAVLDEIGERYDTEFCWGLPINEFLRTLLWTKHSDDYSVSQPAFLRRAPRPDGIFFPSWSWVGWLGGVIFNNIYGIRWRKKRQVDGMIVCPWDETYCIDIPSDHLETGVLVINANLANINLGLLCVDAHPETLHFDENEIIPEVTQCILLGIVDGNGRLETIRTYRWVEYTHLVMAVEQHKNGVYYRKGLIELRKAQWEAQSIATQNIRLG